MEILFLFFAVLFFVLGCDFYSRDRFFLGTLCLFYAGYCAAEYLIPVLSL